MTIQTERLALRPMRQEDLAGLQEMLFDERVMYAYEHRFTPEEAQAWLLRQQRRYREDGFGLWAMVERAGPAREPSADPRLPRAGLGRDCAHPR